MVQNVGYSSGGRTRDSGRRVSLKWDCRRAGRPPCIFKQGQRTFQGGMELVSRVLVSAKECRGTEDRGAAVRGQQIAKRTQSSASTAVNHEGLEPSGRMLSLTQLSWSEVT